MSLSAKYSRPLAVKYNAKAENKIKTGNSLVRPLVLGSLGVWWAMCPCQCVFVTILGSVSIHLGISKLFYLNVNSNLNVLIYKDN